MRKFFRTKLSYALQPGPIEAMLGHQGYLSREYLRAKPHALAEEYKRGMHLLAVFSDGEDLQRLNQQVTDQRHQLTDLTSKLAAKNLDLDQQLQKVKHDLDQQNQLLQQIQRRDGELGDVIARLLKDPRARKLLEDAVRLVIRKNP